MFANVSTDGKFCVALSNIARDQQCGSFQDSECKLGWLKNVLADITEALEHPQGIMVRKSSVNHSRIYDNVNNATTPNGSVNVDPNANMTSTAVVNINRDYNQHNDANLRQVINISQQQQQNNNSDNSKKVQNGSIGQARRVLNTVNGSPQHRAVQPHHRSHQQLRQEHNTVVQSSPKRTLRSHSVESGQDYLQFSVLEKHPINCSAMSPENRRHHREGPPSEQSVNQSWNKMVTAAELVNGDFVDLISFMDENHDDAQNSSVELDNGSQVSIGPMSTMSTVASSGYQSFGYSQSSSPVDTGGQTDTSSLSMNLPVSFANPLFQHLNPAQVSTAGGNSQTSHHHHHHHHSHHQSPVHVSRVTSSSSLSSDDGACSCPSATNSTSRNSKTNNSSSQNTSPYHTYNSYSHDHRYARSLGDVNSATKLSTISSSSSSESLNKDLQQKTQPRRTGHYGSYQRVNGSRGHMVHSLSTRSANLPLDQPPEKLVNPSLTVGELSKSVEYALMSRGLEMSPPTSIKRIATDSVLHQGNSSGDAPRVNGHYSSNRSNSARNAHLPPTAVRMGVNSIHRKQQESEKSRAEVRTLTELSPKMSNAEVNLLGTKQCGRKFATSN